MPKILRNEGTFAHHANSVEIALERLHGPVAILVLMEVERIISQVEWLERVFAVPDTRPLNARDIAAANRRHDEMLAQSPWFRLWQRYGVCCRSESSSVRFGEIEG